jgi:Uma2 family endonuclease
MTRPTRPRNRPGTHNFDDFLLLIRKDGKGDLIDGAIYPAPPETTGENELFVWLLVAVHTFTEQRNLGRVYGPRVVFRIDDRNSLQSDLAFVRKERLHLRRGGFFDGPPDLAIEIVSGESASRDYNAKRDLYQRAGVAEYWIVDEAERRITLLRLGEGGRYHPARLRNGALYSDVLSGFWLRPEWLWPESRLPVLEVPALALDV